MPPNVRETHFSEWPDDNLQNNSSLDHYLNDYEVINDFPDYYQPNQITFSTPQPTVSYTGATKFVDKQNAACFVYPQNDPNSDKISLIINMINKTSEKIDYAINACEQIEKLNTISLGFKCVFADLFLNYFDGTLLNELDNFVNFWTTTEIFNPKPLKFPGCKFVASDIIECGKIDLEFLLLCMEKFLAKYFCFLIHMCRKDPDEVILIDFYGETWKTYLNISMNINHKYSIAFKDLFKDQNNNDTSPILTKCLQCWRYAFFQYCQDLPDAIWRLIVEEENNGPRSTGLINSSVVISYKVLGLIERSKPVDLTVTPCPIDCFEFIDWHMKKYKKIENKIYSIDKNYPKLQKVEKYKKKRSKQILAESKEKTKIRNKSEIKTLYQQLIKQQIKIEKEIKEAEKMIKAEVYFKQENCNEKTNTNSDNDYKLCIQLSYSKNPLKFFFEPPLQKWRKLLCDKFGFSPIQPTEFGPQQELSWDYDPKLHRIQKIKGDGNCLFRSLVFFLTGYDSDVLHVRMRYLICKYMEDHQYDVAILSWVRKYANSVMEYLDRGIRIPGKWGTEVEVQVFARMFNCIVAVWNPEFFSTTSETRWNRYNFYATEYQPTLFLLFEKSHFDVCLM